MAALVSYFAQSGQARVFNAAWRDLVSRSRDWSSRARQGLAALVKLAPDLELNSLWREK